MGKLGKFWSDGFEEDSNTIQDHLLKKETFRIQRIIQENDPYFKDAERMFGSENAKMEINDHNGILFDFLAYERGWDYPRIVTFKGERYEIDPDNRKIMKSDRHFGRSFGQDAVAPFYYIGIETEFFEDLGYGPHQ